MDSADVMLTLRRDQIVVQHVVRTAGPDGRALVVVFLEATYGQADAARRCLRRLPGVSDVIFARHTKAILYVFLGS